MSVIIASKINTSNYFDGCFNKLKKYLTSKLPEGKKWFNNTCIKDLVGNENVVNAYPIPFDDDNSYIEIYFGNNYRFLNISSPQSVRRSSSRSSFVSYEISTVFFLPA